MATRTLSVEFIGDTRNLDKAFSNTRKNVSQTEKLTNRFGSALRTTAAYAGIGGLAGGLAFAAKSGVDFQKQMSELGAVTNATGKRMDDLKKAAISAGAKTAFSAKDAAQAETELAKGGMSVRDILRGGLKSALNLAAAGQIDLKDAASTTADAMNLFGLRGKQAGRVADGLAQAANATTGDVHDFAFALKAGGSAAKAAGLNFNDTVTWLESLARAGIKGQDAGTSLKNALVHLVSPTKQASEKMHQLGLDFFNAQGKMKPLPKISEMLRERLAGMTKQQQLATFATIGGTDGMRGLLALMDTGPRRLEAYSKGLSKQGTAAQVAAKKQDNFSGKLENFKGSLETLAIQVTSGLLPAGEKLLEWMTALVNHVSSVTKAIGSVIGWFKKNITFTEALGAALGVVAAAFVAFKVVTFAQMVPALAAQAGSWIALNAAMLANPIVLIVAALAVLAAAFVVLWKKSETFRDIVTGTWNAIKGAAVAVFGWIKDHWPLLLSILTGPVGAAVLYIVRHWDTVRDTTEKVWNAVTKFLSGVWGGIRDAASDVWVKIKDAITGPVNKAISIVKALVGHGGKEKTGLVGALETAWDAIKGAAGAAWGAIHDAILDPVRRAIDKIRDLIGHGGKDKTGLIGWLDTAWGTISKGIAGFASGLKDDIVDAVRGGLNLVIGFINDIIDALNKIPFVKIGKIQPIAAPKNNGGGGGTVSHQSGQGIAGRARGGLVDHPMVMVGEEAPRHPEYVIPTNPAYRGRALRLLAGAAGALGMPGFAQGGVVASAASANFSLSQLAALWVKAGGPRSAAELMAHIAMAESSGNPGARNPSGASGLWQILGLPFPGNPFDPLTNARMAVAKWQAAGTAPWDASKAAWGQYAGSSGSFLGNVAKTLAGIGGKVAGALTGVDPVALLKTVKAAMPDTGSLPGWLQGLGGSLVSSAVDFAKNKISSLGGLLGGGGAVSATGLVAQVKQALAFARAHGWAGNVTSGFRTRAQQEALYQRYLAGGTLAARPGTSSHEKGQAVDVTDTEGFARAMSMMGAGALKRLVPGEPWHFSVTGHKRGGIIGGSPYVGSFRDGGIVPRDGFAYVHQGETIRPAASQAGPLVQIDRLEVHEDFSEERFARALARQIQVKAGFAA